MKKYIKANLPAVVVWAVQTIIIVLLCAFMLIQTAVKNTQERQKKQILSTIQYCYDYDNGLIYACYATEHGVILEQDREGNNTVVGVIDTEPPHAIG
ncbi:MAG: hypothetical protein IJO14_03360 [Clostridia bacterium]|nr:hypothetical protein [Clostridia bacterium]